MKKEKILDFIKRYYLGGKVEGVIWKTYNDELHVDFVTVDRTMLGVLKSDNFTGIENDVELPILHTNQLIKMIEAHEEDIQLSIKKVDTGDEIKIPYLKISSKDEIGTRPIHHLLGNASVILKPKRIDTDTLPQFLLSFNISKKFIDNFVKYKAVWPDAKTITILESKESGEYEIFFGYSTTNSTYGSLPTGDYERNGELDHPVSLSSDFFKEILVANKTADKIRFDVSQDGLSRVIVNEGDLDITYYLSEMESEM